MADNRQDLRFKLPAASRADFNAAKQRAERELGIAMSANEFAKRVVVQAVRGDQNAGVLIDRMESTAAMLAVLLEDIYPSCSQSVKDRIGKEIGSIFRAIRQVETNDESR